MLLLPASESNPLTVLSHAVLHAGHKKPKVVLHPAAAPAKAPPAAPAKAPPVAAPPSKAKLAHEGEVLGLGGAMHPRAVFHAADNPGVPMLDLKDLAKVCLLSLSHTLWLPCRSPLQEGALKQC